MTLPRPSRGVPWVRRMPNQSSSISREQAREIDRRAVADFGMSSLVLMENAGRGLADHFFELGLKGPVLVCCGTGNNGGDGFVMARHLDLRGVPVSVMVWGDLNRISPDAAANFAILVRSNVPI
ncbi:MAG TPA: NAD(P)H-hydrate epimerase, partial [Pirellulales bacterium]|nr:NAD(P)H-hydrate epimerase [Pirellulales bacterium]